MSWQKEIDELNKRKNLAQKLGGKEKVERQQKRLYAGRELSDRAS